ncbi:MAG: exodeoxyribonuclease V subunit beta [Shewanella sp.]|nr:exodeoxyribonuclease V subunit beta [Shewanella sp.]MCF1456308.1 exodeoxyribonuclease V subunit beta [Shewanella sp.]
MSSITPTAEKTIELVHANKVQPLDPLTLPLNGRRLIEASAGTGKTYTISGLYLRLLLGQQNMPALTCEQILVVTFTNAATEELRDRIRRRIRLCFQRFIGLPVQDDFIEKLYSACPETEHPLALKRLDLALKSLDEAAIFTIHGFCQRILSDMAFESALLFESEFTLDDSQYLAQSVRDYWRASCYPLSETLAGAIAANFATPDVLGRQLRPLLGASQAQASRTPASFDTLKEQLSTGISRLKLSWSNGRDKLETLLHSLPLNGTSYGKQSDGYPKLTAMLQRMDNWAKYHSGLPDAKLLAGLSLSALKLKKGGVLPTTQQAPLLAQIESLNQTLVDLLPAFLFEARARIDQRFHELKAERNLLSPDDLLLTLARAVGVQLTEKQGEALGDQLRAGIAKRFPVALIDEFQDTDPLQYGIFSSIYPATAAPVTMPATAEYQPATGKADTAKPETAKPGAAANTLLMIGDPKQAIYAFRGADIFTYISARQGTAHHYNLGTNFRSASEMVAAVNALFTHSPDPFISQEIPFEPVLAADNGGKTLNEPNSDNRALNIRLLTEDSVKGLNKTRARKLLAADAAEEIVRLLNAAGDATCQLADKNRTLKARDIAVLVRDRNEAGVMQQALKARGVGAVFLSRDSVLGTAQAKEMLLILRALANPRDERTIRSALACRLLGFDAHAIHQFNQSEDLRSEILDTFMQLHEHWNRRGVMPALLMLADRYQLLHRLANTVDADRRLTDFRHLAELLQQKSTELDGTSALVNWYEQELTLNNGAEEQQLRLDSEQNLVQIVTIHKSKGLEYPVCFIPFVSLARDNSRRPSPMLYHCHNRLVWDLDASDEAWELAKRETLAEDLRLLYVALTRPVYRCYLSIANHCRMNKSGINSYLHETAIGYLLGINDKSCYFADLLQATERLCQLNATAMAVQQVSDESTVTPLGSAQNQTIVDYAPLEPAPRRVTAWRVGSYSGLVKHLPHEQTAPGAGDEQLTEEVVTAEELVPVTDRFSFDRGANAGSFMHLVLEKIDFTQAASELPLVLPSAMAQYGIAEHWLDILNDWYLDLLQAPLPCSHIQIQQNAPDAPLRLAELKASQKLVEMEFYLPLGDNHAEQAAASHGEAVTGMSSRDVALSDIALSKLLQRYGYSGELKFEAFQGMLKGFIDLTFEYQGQYFIADYKSNHLGDEFDAYTQVNMSRAIAAHRYDLQYIIYTLALHRLLQNRLANYDYDRHIGGCFYLFLRGMTAAHPGSGVYFDKPKQALILELDALLRGHSNDHLGNNPTSDEQRELNL